jgi:hypothetical protein
MYLVKTGAKAPQDLIEGEELSVHYWPLRRLTGRTIGGLFAEVEGAGVDRSRFLIHVPEALDSRGLTARYSRNIEVPALRVTDRVREMTAEDAALVAQQDKEIEAIKRQLREAREERVALIAGAFRRGRKVYDGDLRERVSSE